MFYFSQQCPPEYIANAYRLNLRFEQHPRPQWVRTTLIAEAVLQAIATVVAFATPDSTYLLIVILAVAMGLRNGTVRKLSVPDMTTTVLTMTLTGLASDSSLAGGDNPRALRRLSAVTSMLVGAFAGAMLLRHAGLDWALLAAAILVTLAALAYRES